MTQQTAQTQPERLVIKFDRSFAKAQKLEGSEHAHLIGKALVLKALPARFAQYAHRADKYVFNALRYTIAESGELIILAGPIETRARREPVGNSTMVKYYDWYLASDFEALS